MASIVTMKQEAALCDNARRGDVLRLVDLDGLLASGVFGSPTPGKRTVLRWVKDGRLPSYKIGTFRRYSIPEIQAHLLKTSRVAASAE